MPGIGVDSRPNGAAFEADALAYLVTNAIMVKEKVAVEMTMRVDSNMSCFIDVLRTRPAKKPHHSRRHRSGAVEGYALRVLHLGNVERLTLLLHASPDRSRPDGHCCFLHRTERQSVDRLTGDRIPKLAFLSRPIQEQCYGLAIPESTVISYLIEAKRGAMLALTTGRSRDRLL